MHRLVGTACMLEIAAAAVISAPMPARAQFAGGEMEQFAPMLEMMKKRMGKRRYGQLMRTVGPMMADIMDNSGGGFSGFGGYGGGGFGGYGSMRGMMGMANSFNFGSLRGLRGFGRHGRRHFRRGHGQ